jgi:hypothetical protein
VKAVIVGQSQEWHDRAVFFLNLLFYIIPWTEYTYSGAKFVEK